MNLLSTPIREKSHLEKLIPHREPFKMVSGLVFIDQIKCISEFEILTSNIFVDNNLFSEAGILENMAQTAALDFGYRTSDTGIAARIGYIAAIPKSSIIKLPKVKDVISTELLTDFNSLELKKVRITTKLDNEVIATAEMIIVLKTDV